MSFIEETVGGIPAGGEFRGAGGLGGLLLARLAGNHPSWDE